MQWRTVRLDRNHRLGRIGDLVEAPEALACEMIRDGRAETLPAMERYADGGSGPVSAPPRLMIGNGDSRELFIETPPGFGRALMRTVLEQQIREARRALHQMGFEADCPC